MKAKLHIEVEFDENITDAESIASAMDTLVEAALSTPGVLDDYGNPKVGGFFVLDTQRASEHADMLDGLIDRHADDLGKMLQDVRDFLRQIGTVK